MTRSSRVEIGLISQSTRRQGGVTKHETNENVQKVDLKPLETRPHHVSGARRVAAPVPRTGEQAQGFKNNNECPHTPCGRRNKAQGQVATCSAWKTKEKEDTAFSQTKTTSAVVRQAYVEQKQKRHLWRCC